MRGRAVFVAAFVAGAAWLAAASACAAAPPAPPLTATFATFQQFCVAPHGHAAQILAQADAAGWTPGPASMTAAPQFKSMTEVGVRTKTDAGAQALLVAGSGPIGEFSGLAVSADLCVLTVKGIDGPAVAADVGAWVGVPPDPKRTKPGDVTYSFTEDVHGRVAVIDPSDEEAKALVKAGKVHMVIVQFTEDHAMVGYFTPRL